MNLKYLLTRNTACFLDITSARNAKMWITGTKLIHISFSFFLNVGVHIHRKQPHTVLNKRRANREDTQVNFDHDYYRSLKRSPGCQNRLVNKKTKSYHNGTIPEKHLIERFSSAWKLCGHLWN